MLKSFEHVGMTVSDMDRTVDFYCGLLGLSLVLRKTMANGMQVAFLDAGGGMLEVFAPPGGASRAIDVPEDTAGVRHLTFHFDNVDEAFARLEQAGVEIKERPHFAVHSEMLNKIAFVRDPRRHHRRACRTLAEPPGLTQAPPIASLRAVRPSRSRSIRRRMSFAAMQGFPQLASLALI